MKIATWNVNSIRTRKEIVANWLKANPVDVLCLQETKVVDQDFPRSHFESLGYHIYISGQKSYNGVAIFSLKPLEDISTGFTPLLGSEQVEDFDEQKRVITGIVDGIRIVNLYIPNGAEVGSEKYEYKLRWMKVLKEYLRSYLEKPPHNLCVCGDLNITPDDRDIHDPKNKEKSIAASPRERAALQDVLEIGLADAFRKFTVEGGHYSWWDYRHSGFSRNHGWRIDIHYLTPNLYERATNCWIDVEPRKLEKPSDHAPVIVEIGRD